MTGHPSGPPPPARSPGYTSVIRAINTVAALSELTEARPSVCLQVCEDDGSGNREGPLAAQPVSEDHPGGGDREG